MFVKILREGTKSEEGKPAGMFPSEEVFECEAYSVIDGFDNPPKGLEYVPMKTLIINPHKNSFENFVIGINPRNTQLFIMNDEGKTVDYYLWATEE